MKEVVFLVPSLGMGGMERVLVNYANMFSRRGYDVTVLNFTFDDEAIVSGFDPDIHYYKQYAPVKNLFHSSFKQILKGNFRLLPWEKWIKFHSARFLYKKYIKKNYDIEIAFFGMTALKIIGGSSNSNAKKIGWLHSVNLEDDIRDLGSKEKAKRIYMQIQTLICVSNVSKEKIMNVFGRTKNVYVVNNPNDTYKIRKLALESVNVYKFNFTFVLVARIDEYSKGFFRLLNVCKRLNNELFEYTLWIVGEGIDYARVVAHSNELQLKNVYFFGKKANPYPYIKNADFYLCSSNFEGFSMVMMEAIILGTPILSTAVSGADEMLDNGKYGMIVENSEEGLYQGMKNILSDPALWEHYKKMALMRKDYLNEEKIMDQVEAIIEGQILDE